MNESLTDHPNALRLDAIVVGSGDEETMAHVTSCAKCAAYVDELQKGALAFSHGEGARAELFVAGVKKRDRAARAIPWVTTAFGGLAAAAAILLFVHFRAVQSDVDRVALLDPPGQGPARFKGGKLVAIIVKHGAEQTRTTDALALSPDDQIRVEIAVDHDERVASGFLGENGDWAQLQAPTMLTPGTHYSDEAVTFEHDVSPGWVLVGAPDAIAHARKTRDFADVIAIRVRPKPL